MKKIAIIGVAFCSLSVAHFLKDRAKITIFEKRLA
jgi:predicted NAD/FAD-binding protein